ncbi:MAG TPA: DUF1329 domain-containing protein [Candidatus Binataceae bacterium]|jgi:hypothetical protein|nr:DUF1329 domain-containing protein [Candidatus Binataceae bacterium]
MKRRAAILAWILGMTCLVWLPSRAAQAAGFTYSDQEYSQLADASSPDTIPPGTKITVDNWQQYKKFMPLSLQAAFRGDYSFHLSNDPQYTLVVAPTTPLPPPRQYVADSEKYGSQTQLVPAPTGGFTMKNWIAGAPFPNPSEPNKGVKLLYDAWCTFRPFNYHNFSVGYLVDRFGNKSANDSDAQFFNLSHLSEPGLPINMPYANGNFYVSRFIVTAPEQSKYTTELQMQPDDPMKHPETYVFLPSLRRSLRLSSAARCSPINGTDWVQDDNAWNPPNYIVKFLGQKKILVNIQDRDMSKSLTPKAYVGITEANAGTMPGWPKAGTGHWELRTTDIIDARWIPSLGSYCFTHRIHYVDHENWVTTLLEEYDNSEKLWKSSWNKLLPLKIDGQETLFLDAYAVAWDVDWQNGHLTAGSMYDPKFNKEITGEYADVQGLSQPSSLARVMK